MLRVGCGLARGEESGWRTGQPQGELSHTLLGTLQVLGVLNRAPVSSCLDGRGGPMREEVPESCSRNPGQWCQGGKLTLVPEKLP